MTKIRWSVSLTSATVRLWSVPQKGSCVRALGPSWWQHWGVTDSWACYYIAQFTLNEMLGGVAYLEVVHSGFALMSESCPGLPFICQLLTPFSPSPLLICFFFPSSLLDHHEVRSGPHTPNCFHDEKLCASHSDLFHHETVPHPRGQKWHCPVQELKFPEGMPRLANNSNT